MNINEIFEEAKYEDKDLIYYDGYSTVINNYYNPDSSCGGQWVKQYWDFKLVKEAITEMLQFPNEFPDCLNSDAPTFLMDKTSEEFEEYENNLFEKFKEGEITISSNKTELKKLLISFLQKMQKSNKNIDDIDTEICVYCEKEFSILWNEKDGFEAFCPHCGRKVMLCSLCMNCHDNPTCYCDWNGKTKCCYRTEEKSIFGMLFTENEFKLLTDSLTKYGWSEMNVSEYLEEERIIEPVGCGIFQTMEENSKFNGKESVNYQTSVIPLTKSLSEYKSIEEMICEIKSTEFQEYKLKDLFPKDFDYKSRLGTYIKRKEVEEE